MSALFFMPDQTLFVDIRFIRRKYPHVPTSLYVHFISRKYPHVHFIRPTSPYVHKVVKVGKVTSCQITVSVRVNSSQYIRFTRTQIVKCSFSRQPCYIYLLCKVLKCERRINPYRSNVDLNSTALSSVSGPMSNSTRHIILQCFMLALSKPLPCNGCS